MMQYGYNKGCFSAQCVGCVGAYTELKTNVGKPNRVIAENDRNVVNYADGAGHATYAT